MRIVDWLKNKSEAVRALVDERLARGVPELVPPDHPEEEEEDEEEEDVKPPAYRFRVTTQDEPPRTLFVYGRDEADARSKLHASLSDIARVEAAGHTEGGVILFPPEELREVMASMQDGRKAPGS